MLASAGSGGAHGVGLRTLLALDDLEGDPLALVETLVPVGLDGRVVHEDVLAAVDGDEAEALLGVEPLHGALDHGGAPRLTSRPRTPRDRAGAATGPTAANATGRAGATTGTGCRTSGACGGGGEPSPRPRRR